MTCLSFKRYCTRYRRRQSLTDLHFPALWERSLRLSAIKPSRMRLILRQGAKWEALKVPKADGSIGPILQYRNHLHDSSLHIDSAEGTILRTNLVYGGVHQEGGRTKAYEIRAVSAKALRFGGRFAKKVNLPRIGYSAASVYGCPLTLTGVFLMTLRYKDY